MLRYDEFVAGIDERSDNLAGIGRQKNIKPYCCPFYGKMDEAGTSFSDTQEGAFLLPRARAGARLSYIMRRDAAQVLLGGNGERWGSLANPSPP